MEDVCLADRVVFSPGPGLPEEQKAMFRILETFGKEKPVLGICLGHQAIAIHYGGELTHLGTVVHGQPARLRIEWPEHFLFGGIPQENEVGLYHSWAVRNDTLPVCLDVLARTETGVIMAIAHNAYPVAGLQFHPESIITRNGLKIMNNWLDHSF